MKPKAPKWTWIVATGLGSGLLNPAPGTWGSLAGVGAWCLLSRMLLTPFSTWVASQPTSIYLMHYILITEFLIILFIVFAVYLAVFVSNLAVKETGEKDPGYIVIDEWVGVWIALWPVRWEIAQIGHNTIAVNLWWLPILPFLVFRFLDIWKPWPIRQIQVLPDGYGIVADDVVAGLCSIPIVSLLAPYVIQMIIW
jgi:phosphatidylglycerophosphatase A